MRAQLVLPFLACLTVAAAVAQNSEAPKMSSRAEFKKCLADMDDMKDRERRIAKRGEEQQAGVKQLQDEIRAHAAGQLKMPPKTKAAVDEYNRTVTKFMARASALNREAEEVTRESTAFNMKAAEINSRCAGMVVSVEDHEAVMKEREEQSKK